MASLVSFFKILLYQPLLNALVLFYHYIPGRDFGIAIIFLAILIKLLLYPLEKKTLRNQRIFNEIQPRIKEIQEKYRNDKQTQMKLIMELYKEKKMSPFSGFLPILIQLPVLIALYQVFLRGIFSNNLSNNLYWFLPEIEYINPLFLGIVNLAKPNLFLAILAGITQFYLTRISTKTMNFKKKKTDPSQLIMRQMNFLFPFFTVVIFLRLPSAIALFWSMSNILSIFLQSLPSSRKKIINPQQA